MKQLAGKEIAKYVQNGQTIGVGTGSTVQCAIEEIGIRIKQEGLKISALTTSLSSALLCAENGITVLDNVSFKGQLDWGFDGADELDPAGRVIKGQGAAMLIEKIVAYKCRKFFIIADETKLVTRFGEKFPVPVEVIPEALSLAEEQIKAYSGVAKVELRSSVKGKYGPVSTDKGNFVLDVTFNEVPQTAERDLKAFVGVVETGIFDNIVAKAIIAGATGIQTREFSY